MATNKSKANNGPITQQFEEKWANYIGTKKQILNSDHQKYFDGLYGNS